MASYLLSIDQGTTSSKAIVFNNAAEPVGIHQVEFTQYFPKNGWVEHSADEIWDSVIECCQHAVEKAKITFKDIMAIGIANQRETTLIWDKKTGKTIYPAIVWQDRRTTNTCNTLKNDKTIEKLISDKTGLLLDPYFSATKIAWILDNVSGARKRAENGELAFGTIDTFLLWRLTNGHAHATDATNASRTLLFNIKTQSWDDELLKLFNIPRAILPTVLDSNANFGKTAKTLFNHEIPITGVAGDQQAATIGQACLSPGMIKSTYGTGSFLLMNTGNQIVRSSHRLLTTIAYRVNGETTYGLEGSIFAAGSTIQWLRDTLKLIPSSNYSEIMAQNIKDTNGVYFVPAFSGLGAPYWQPDARASLVGMTRETNAEHITRAALESVCYQTLDLINAMSSDFIGPITTLRVDGGMTANNWLLQYLADITALTVNRPACIQTTAQGAAFLAGLGVGLYKNLSDITTRWTLCQSFAPSISKEKRNHYYAGWRQAIKQTLLPC